MGTRKIKAPHMRGLWDHPHAYGDKLWIAVIQQAVNGSSPRVWGQECPPARVATASRIIPTRMGTSTGNRHTIRVYWDHPHAYGDKLYAKLV